MVQLTSDGKLKLDNLVAKISADETTPSFVLGATAVDEEIYFNAGGYKLVNDPSSGQVDKDSIFWICSQTKMITHLAALQLIEQGKLAQDTPVSDIFPQFSNPVILEDVMSPNASYTPTKTKILVKHLLNFTSGLFYPPKETAVSVMLPPYGGPHDMQNPHSTFFDILKGCTFLTHLYTPGNYPGIPLKFEPGTNFVYGYSSDILGFIVEKLSGKTLEEYFQENIFKPLGITGSFYLTPDVEQKLLPLSFRRADGKLETWTDQPEVQLMERDPTKISRHLGGVGLYVSLRDYLTLLRHLLQIKSGRATHPILKAETVDSLFIPVLNEAGINSVDQFTRLPFTGNSWSTALAVATVDWANRRNRGTAFWSGWAGTFFWMDPTAGVAGVFGTQLTSTATSGSRDPATVKAWGEFEETLYAGLD